MLFSIALLTGYSAIALALIGRMRFFQLPGISRRLVCFLFLLKVLASLATTAIYTYYYTDHAHADLWRYFNDAMVIRDLWSTDRSLFWRFFWGDHLQGPEVEKVFEHMTSFTQQYDYGFINNNVSMIRCNLIVSLFTGGHYLAHIPWMALISFCGSVLIYKTIPTHPQYRIFILLLLFCIPSNLLWTSSVLKEAPIMFGLGLLWYALWNWSLKPKWIHFFLLMIGAIWLVVFRGFMVIAILPPAIFLLLAPLFQKRSIAVHAVASVGICIGVIAGMSHVFPAGTFLHVLNLKREAFANEAVIGNARSVIALTPSGNYVDLFVHAPFAWFTAWFRPLPGEGFQLFLLVASIENLVVLLLLTLLLLQFRNPNRSQWLWIISSFMLVAGLGGIIGNTVCVLGAIARYKAIAVFFLPIAFVLMSDFDSWQKALTFFRRRHSAS